MNRAWKSTVYRTCWFKGWNIIVFLKYGCTLVCQVLIGIKNAFIYVSMMRNNRKKKNKRYFKNKIIGHVSVVNEGTKGNGSVFFFLSFFLSFLNISLYVDKSLVISPFCVI